MYRDRPKDAYAALQYLQAQPFVRPDRIGLMGWSQGGRAVLLSINDKSIGRPAGLKQDFVAAVAFYPGACSERQQSKPFTEVEPQQWTTAIPLLVLFGEADVWTLFPPCEAFISAAKARGNPVELKSYPSAVHAFDTPNQPVKERPEYRTRDGRIPLTGTDKDARADAFPRVLEFLKASPGIELSERRTPIIPGRASSREPGIHNHGFRVQRQSCRHGGYGFRACAQERASRNDGAIQESKRRARGPPFCSQSSGCPGGALGSARAFQTTSSWLSLPSWPSSLPSSSLS